MQMADLLQLSFSITKCYHLGIASNNAPFSYDYLVNDYIHENLVFLV